MTISLPLLPIAPRATARASLVAALCASLLAPDAFAALPTEKPANATTKAARAHLSPLTPQEKALHALNRLTFGPRPGDVAAAEKLGLDAWFERQLHPEQIDDSAFEARMAQFPLLQLPQSQLIEDFPGPLRIRFMLQTGQQEPPTNDPVVRAVYADYIARYKVGLALQAAGGKQGDLTAQTLSDAVSGKLADQAREQAKPVSADATPARGRGNLLGTAAYEKLPPSTLTAEQIRAIVQLPADERFQRIVAMSPSDNIKFSIATAPFPQAVLAGFTPWQREMYGAMQQPVRVVSTETLGSRILRDTYSERQLQAVMDDFWLNHFSVYVRKNQFEPYFLASYERDAILPNALGSFEKLLIATAESPAMLMYLDNWQSVGPDSPFAARVSQAKKRSNGVLVQMAPEGINENYARELMELHTVGVGGGYTQKDVVEVAKCFTGWTLNRPYAAAGGQGSGEAQAFRFDPTRHEGGDKFVLGHVIPAGGMDEGLAVLHILATSPQTAHFISRKLAVRFVSDAPPEELVDRMAATFLKTNGDISAVLSTMFHSREFWSRTVYRAKVKTPIEFMVSALRAANASVATPGLLVQAVDRLGMPIFGMQTPNGYSWQSSDWVSSSALVNRMNFALVLSGDHLRGASTDWPAVLGVAGNTTLADAPTPATEKQLELAILGEPATQRTRDTVLQQFSSKQLQAQAAKDFSLGGQAEPAPAMTAAEGPATEPKRRTYGAGAGQFRLNLDGAQPESPLDTMAGLLLGSPEFQRR